METSTFGRRADQRKALMRGLATSLLDKGRIETTLVRAKELRKVVEPLITLGKRGDLHARRQAASYLYGKQVVSKLFGEVAQQFKDRPGGYTRIYQVGQRRGDGAKMALIELISEEKAKKSSAKKSSKKKAEGKEKAPKKEAKKAEPKKVTSSTKKAAKKTTKKSTKSEK